jgi:hypothetical protein
MSQATSAQPLTLTRSDLDVLLALSLKGYRFLTCRHLCMLYYPSQEVCRERMAKLQRAGLVARLFLPAVEGERKEPVYTLAQPGGRELARLRGISPLGLASARKPSYLFLEHGLRVSDFMCSLEAGLKGGQGRLLSWRSERQLKPARGRALRVPHPSELGEKIPLVPDGLFSLEIGGRVEHFFLEADRGTMPLSAMGKKMLGYIQLFRRGLHRSYFGVPHFRVLLVTTTPLRRDRLREILKDIGYCPNMFWFALWWDISPEKILRRIWLKCGDRVRHSLLG